VLQRGAQLRGAAQPDPGLRQRRTYDRAVGEASGQGDLPVLPAGLAAQPAAGAARGVQRVQLPAVQVRTASSCSGLEPLGARQHRPQPDQRDRAGQPDRVLRQQQVHRRLQPLRTFAHAFEDTLAPDDEKRCPQAAYSHPHERATP
jgi:hypothetical protein